MPALKAKYSEEIMNDLRMFHGDGAAEEYSSLYNIRRKSLEDIESEFNKYKPNCFVKVNNELGIISKIFDSWFGMYADIVIISGKSKGEIVRTYCPGEIEAVDTQLEIF